MSEPRQPMNDKKSSVSTSPNEKPSEGGGGNRGLGVLAWLPWIAAAGFALLAGFIAQAYLTARSEIAVLREQGAFSEIERKSLQQTLEAERILSGRRVADLLESARTHSDLTHLRIVALTSPADQQSPGSAVALWDPQRQEGSLIAWKLPGPPADKEYQIWIVDPEVPAPVSAGVLPVQSSTGETRIQFKPDRPVAAARFIVTVAAKGRPAGTADPIVLSGQ